MIRKLRIAFLFLLLAPFFEAQAQKVDIGLMVGGSYYYGDVVNELELATIRYSAGGFLRYRLNERFALKGFGAFARVSGDDKYSSSAWQKQRNWNFFTDIIEGSLQLEYNLIEDRNRGRKFKNKMIPYVFGGVGAFYFKPQTQLVPGGSAQSLPPLQLSGVKYEQTAICIPFGIGVRYYVLRNVQIGAELGIRYTTTSYIDDIGGNDVYQDPATTPVPSATEILYARSGADRNPGDPRGKMGRGAFKVNDIYVLGGVTLAYTFGKGGGGGRGFGGKAIRCPRFY